VEERYIGNATTYNLVREHPDGVLGPVGIFGGSMESI